MLRELLEQAARRLPGETPALDAQVLLAHVAGHNRAWVMSHPEATLSPPQIGAFEAGIGRLLDGAPLPYVLGLWEFFGLEFEVTPAVLIPRPETELLVETALDWIRNYAEGQARADRTGTILDIGTGSGCIAIALATHLPEAHLTATDISQAALAVARRNAERNGVAQRIEFVECDLLPPAIDETAGPGPTLITANLPYIPTADLRQLSVARSEPVLALDGGPDGLALIRRLLQALSTRITHTALILLEIEARQGPSARAVAEAGFPQAGVEIRKDLSGNDRLLVIET